MEKEENRNKRRKQRKTQTCVTSSSSSSSVDYIFPVLLATLFKSQDKPNNSINYSLIKKCLTKLRFLLTSPNPSLSPQQPILALLPALLNSKCAGIARRSAEIVGAFSLVSLEMNEAIALDGEIIAALVSALGNSRNRSVSAAACNAVLDISSASVGRHRLLEFSTLDTLMFGFLQFPVSSMPVCVCIWEEGSAASITFKEDGYALSLLHAAITLLNTCNFKQLEMTPRKLLETFLSSLKKLWAEVHKQMLAANISKSSRGRYSHLRSIGISKLAESIFRLSINASEFAIYLPSVLVEQRIFCSEPFDAFLLNHWEASASLVRRLSWSLFQEDDIFSLFAKSFNCKESPTSLVSSILQSCISCLPIGSDELDILNFLEEVRNELGCPIVYQQDIRVLRTEKQSKSEVHFFQEKSDPLRTKPSQFLQIPDIMKCEEAYKEGYTIALRGLEFRFASIAAVADTLASLFGQPSVGANMYLTPPESQGLACHYDDHCVFVCQLFGTKKWSIFSPTNLQLPRLYDPCDNPNCLEVSSLAGCRKFLLREGDILYIPRGFPHEACTDDGESSNFAKFSLHLTFGIEVEPPFEWEGFVHLALHCWKETQKQPHPLVGGSSGILNTMSVNLLHAMIELIGASDPTFRKACLVAALPLPLDTNHWLYLNQKTAFNHLIEKISACSMFLQVLRSVEVSIGKNEDPFQRMRWLQQLNQCRESIQGHDWDAPFAGIENLLPIYTTQKDIAEAAFIKIKSKFCNEVIFDGVIDNYTMLFEKYKKVRKQYMNGMLALHCS